MKYQFYVKVSSNGGDELYSELYTLIVGCTTDYTLTQHSGFTTSKNVMVNSATSRVYRIKEPTPSGGTPAWCPITYSISNLLLNSAASVGNEIAFESAQPCIWLDLLTTSYAYVLTFNIVAHVGTGPSLLTSSLVTITVESCLNVNTIGQDASLVSAYTWQITNADPFVLVPPFTHSNSNCPITSIQIYTDSSGTGVSPPPNMAPASVTSSLTSSFSVTVDTSQRYIPHTYTFSIKVTGTEN